MINVGIIGCGFVGGALKDWLEHNNPECKLFISDPAKGYHDDMKDIDIAFLQIHVRTEDDGTQDLSLMKELISALPDVPVFVRTTILPGSSELLSKETGHHVHYMPEFLTERTHIEDFKKQTMVFTGALELLTKIFIGKKFTVMTLLRQNSRNIAQCVWSIQVTYFNACREYCEKWVPIGVQFIPAYSFLGTSTTHTPMFPVLMVSSATEANVSLKMLMHSQR